MTTYKVARPLVTLETVKNIHGDLLRKITFQVVRKQIESTPINIDVTARPFCEIKRLIGSFLSCGVHSLVGGPKRTE